MAVGSNLPNFKDMHQPARHLNRIWAGLCFLQTPCHLGRATTIPRGELVAHADPGGDVPRTHAFPSSRIINNLDSEYVHALIAS